MVVLLLLSLLTTIPSVVPFVAVRVRLVERLVSFDAIWLTLVAGNVSVTHRLRWTDLWLFVNEETRIRNIELSIVVADVSTIVDGISNVADGRQGVSECCFSHMLWFV